MCGCENALSDVS